MILSKDILVITKITNKQQHMFEAYISNIVLQIGDVYNSIQLIEADKDKQSILYSVLNSEYKSLHSKLTPIYRDWETI